MGGVLTRASVICLIPNVVGTENRDLWVGGGAVNVSLGGARPNPTEMTYVCQKDQETSE